MTLCALTDRRYNACQRLIPLPPTLGHRSPTDSDLLKAENSSFDVVGPSNIPISPKKPAPRALTVDEIKTYV
jgi:hypothetical protein